MEKLLELEVVVASMRTGIAMPAHPEATFMVRVTRAGVHDRAGRR